MLLVVQQSCILASLLSLLYGPKLYHSTSELRFNFQKTIERTSVHAVVCVAASAALFVATLRTASGSSLAWGLTISSVIFLSCGVCLSMYVAVQLMRLLAALMWSQRRVANHHQLFDFCVALLLAVFCCGDFIIAIWGAFHFRSSALGSRQVLVGYTAMQILLAGLTGLLCNQRAKKQAKFKHEKLQGRLNLIRYVSHEMRTPLNTAFMGLNILSDELEGLKLLCVSDSVHDVFGSRPLSSSASSVSTVGQKCAPAISFRSDMVFVGKTDAQASLSTASQAQITLASDTNASSSTQLDAYAAPQVATSSRRQDAGTSPSTSSFSIRSSTSDFGLSLGQPQPSTARRCSDVTLRSQQTCVSMETLDDLHATVQQIGESCKVALATLDDLLTFDKLDEQKLTVDTQRTHPWAFLSAAAQPFRLNAREAQVRLEIGARRTESQWFDRVAVDVDPFKLSQVVRNLLSNAIKFTPPDGRVTVLLEPLFDVAAVLRPDEARASDDEPLFVRISVSDSGAGISVADQQRLFGQYVQFNASKLQKGKGSGLGLWITKSIVELHGGRIGCRSDGEGRGATFYVDLPATRAALPCAVPPPPELAAARGARPDAALRRSHSARRRSMLSQRSRAGSRGAEEEDDDDDDDLGQLDDAPPAASARLSSFFAASTRSGRHSPLQRMGSLGRRVMDTAAVDDAHRAPPRAASSLFGDLAGYLLGVASGGPAAADDAAAAAGRAELAPQSQSPGRADPELGLGLAASSPTAARRAAAFSASFFAAATSPATPSMEAATVSQDASLPTASQRKPGGRLGGLSPLEAGEARSSSHEDGSASSGSSPTRHKPLPATPPHAGRLSSFLQALQRAASPGGSPSSSAHASPAMHSAAAGLSVSVAGYSLPRSLPLSDRVLSLLTAGGSGSAPCSPSHVSLAKLSPSPGKAKFGARVDVRIEEGADGEEDEGGGDEDATSTRATRPDLGASRLALTLSHEQLRQHALCFPAVAPEPQPGAPPSPSLPSSVGTPAASAAASPLPLTPQLSPAPLGASSRSPSRSPLAPSQSRRSALGLVPDAQLSRSRQHSRQNSRAASPLPPIIKTPPRSQFMTQLPLDDAAPDAEAPRGDEASARSQLSDADAEDAPGDKENHDAASSLDSAELDAARFRFVPPSLAPGGSTRSGRATLRPLGSQQSLGSLASLDGTVSSHSTASRSLSASLSRTSSRCLDFPASPRLAADGAAFSRSFSRSFDPQDALTQLSQPLHALQRPLDPRDGDALGSAVAAILDSPEQPSATAAAPQLQLQRWADGLNVLVVDDSAPNRKVCGRLLSGRGHRVVEAVDGRHCLDVFARLAQVQQERVDLVLLDDNMPHLCGPDAARQLRSRCGFAGAIVGVTGDVEAATVQRFLAAGADAVLAKPLSVEALRGCYDRFVAEHSQ